MTPPSPLRAGLFWLGLALCVLVPAGLIVQKERLLATGRVVYLRLVPVDPRSLMQGDYMDLRYAVADAADDATRGAGGEPPDRGVLVVALDANGVGEFRRLDDGAPLAPEEQRLKFHGGRRTFRFGAESYFFEEGSAERYQGARYGKLRVSEAGELLLAALCDASMNEM